jgi:hypothetical protein
MGQVLDILALRSLVAMADCGGFHRAAGTGADPRIAAAVTAGLRSVLEPV